MSVLTGAAGRAEPVGSGFELGSLQPTEAAVKQAAEAALHNPKAVAAMVDV